MLQIGNQLIYYRQETNLYVVDMEPTYIVHRKETNFYVIEGKPTYISQKGNQVIYVERPAYMLLKSKAG